MGNKFRFLAAPWDRERRGMTQRTADHWGAHSLCFSLPMAHVNIVGLSSNQLDSLKESYPGFITEGAQTGVGRGIECTAFRLEQPIALPSGALARDGQYTPLQIWQPDGLHLTGANFEARLALNSQHASTSLGVARENDLSLANVIENFLRIVAAHQSLQQGGLVLHSAGLVFDDQAYIFCGRSNAGKTTLTRKADRHGALVLSDDINVLLPSHEGYQAHAVPFTGEFGRTLDHKGGQEAYPVKGIILLEQGRKMATMKVKTSDAVATLLAGCPFVNTSAETSPALFDAVISLVTKLPVVRLVCTRNDSVGEIMDAVNESLENDEEIR